MALGTYKNNKPDFSCCYIILYRAYGAVARPRLNPAVHFLSTRHVVNNIRFCRLPIACEALCTRRHSRLPVTEVSVCCKHLHLSVNRPGNQLYCPAICRFVLHTCISQRADMHTFPCVRMHARTHTRKYAQQFW